MEALLTIRSDDAPSGENLEYEPVFSALELAAQPGEEKQAGDQIVPAEPPDYRDVIGKALAVLDLSHDLRAALHLALAELTLNGFPGFAKVTSYMRGCLEQYWDSCHPQLDAEDDDDPTMRVNTVLGLASETTIIKAIRAAPLTKSNAFGIVNLRDIEVAKGEATPVKDAGNVLDLAAIGAAFKDTKPEVLQEIFEGANGALEDIKAIDAVFNDRIPGLGPDLNPLLKILQRAVKRLADESGNVPGDAAAIEAAAETPEEGAAAAPGVAASVPGAINNAQDVQSALDRIIAYYGLHEPSSPVPIMLTRAKRLVGADFMTILKDMAPGGLDSARMVAGTAEKDEK